jgi:Protein of unknown function (DUF3800)
VLAQNQFYSRTQHFLLSTYGSRWSKVNLAMLNAYIDDSGTAQEQKVAIASILVIPAKRIALLENEWENFRKKHGFDCFHTSVCVARNHKYEFRDWDDAKVATVISRMRQIVFKYSVRAFSMSINKSDYDEVIPAEFRELAGRYHFTWAIRSAIKFVDVWAQSRKTPIEYVFDFMGPAQKRERDEVDEVMEQSEEDHPGRFLGHYSFRNRCEIPSLQCADLLAWTCYQASLAIIHKHTIHPMAKGSWSAFVNRDNKDWLTAAVQTKKQLREWVEKEVADGRAIERFKRWKERRSGAV